MTLIQRFGSALNLNIHFHMLFLDGVYVERPDGAVRFRSVGAPTAAELTRLTETIARCVGRSLERQGLLERDAENSYLVGDECEGGPMAELMGASITYRVAIGPQQGRRVFTLQTLPAGAEPGDDGVGKVAGFSLHAGVAARAQERKKRERLCRYISRPPVAEKRLSLTSGGNVRYPLKTPYRDGTPPRPLRAAGLHRPAGGAGAQAQSESDALPRRLRPEQPLSGAGDAGGAG